MFAEKVRKNMKLKGLSQTGLARAIGTSQQVVSKWLKKNKPPKVESLSKLATALGVSVEYLIDDSVAGKELKEDEEYVLQVYRDLKADPAQRLDGAEAVRRLSLPPDRRNDIAHPVPRPGQSAEERDRAAEAERVAKAERTAEAERAARKDSRKKPNPGNTG